MEGELVLVISTDDLGRYLFAKSLLERDSIEYVARGETHRMAQGWNQSGWTDTPVEPVELWVRPGDANRAVLLCESSTLPDAVRSKRVKVKD